MAKSILGALLFDKKPKVPDLPELDLTEAQQQAISGNLANLPGMEKLASQVNNFLSQQINAAAERIMPGYSKLLGTSTEALQSAVEGNLPEGVATNIRRYAAERGVGSGTVGSQFEDFSAVNLLGRESLQYSMNALNTADRWLSQARQATPLFNFQSMFISPAQQFAANQYNQQTQFQHQWMKNQLDAMPEGWEAAVQGLMDWVATTSLNVAGAYAGGGMGTGGQAGQSPSGQSYSQQFSSLGSGMSGMQGQERNDGFGGFI